MAFVSDVRAHKGAFAERVHDFVEAVRRYRLERQVRNQTYRELLLLSDRDLADLGMHRSEIRRISIEAGRMAA